MYKNLCCRRILSCKLLENEPRSPGKLLEFYFWGSVRTLIVSRWPSLAAWVSFTLPQLAQIDISCVDVPLNTKQTNKCVVFCWALRQLDCMLCCVENDSDSCIQWPITFAANSSCSCKSYQEQKPKCVWQYCTDTSGKTWFFKF